MRGELETVIGIIGYGYWGPNLARNFLDIEGARVKYICDSSDERLAEAGGKCPGVELVKETEKVIFDEEVQAVVVASSAVTHYPISKAALEAGKHVLVEKPLSLRIEEGNELIETASGSGLVLMVGHLLMYHPAVAFLKEYVDSGKAGRIYYIYSQRLNLGRLRHDENCLWSLAPHDISVMLYLLDGEPESVVARGASYLREDLEDVVFCTLYFPAGQVASLHVSWLDPHKVRRFTIVGSEKMLVFDDMSPDEKLRIFDKKAYPARRMVGYGDEFYLHDGEELVPEFEMEEPLRRECLHFLECIRTGEEPLSSGEEGLNVLKVLDAADRSMGRGGVPVEIEKG